MRIRLKIVAVAAALAATAVMTGSAFAQGAWPARNVTIIVPYSAGGATDILARKVAEELTGELGRTFIVDNRPGAGATLGTTLAAQARPDGYTLFLGQVSSHGIAPNLYTTLQYDAVEDFEPIVMLESIPNLVVVNNDLPVTTLDELIEYARENPGALNFASSGTGASTHLSGEMFKSRTDTEMTHIPFPGSAQAVTAVMSGETQVTFDNMPSAYPHVRSGNMRALAVTSAERSPAAPDVPTVAEASTVVDLSGFEAASWFALFAPSGTPQEVITAVNEATNRILEKPSMIEFMRDGGGTPGGGTPQDLADHVTAELAKWGQVIEEAGVPKQ
ncbi:Bug family tripartite tricarboxylate transporter substrate binding protein [Aureimonas mangrovi]|uniref:Bug family tripartite tricarboxylate transporter substrate binding protein n=1 Tax=Aureimonas mangrovi TaxID=2758041 RepID=UPI001FEB75EC|nr:tripartite tricarboxylate transporter substrate binding protein [Aureimonas mangrovi]